MLLRPGRGALDDEQMLAGTDVPDPPGLARQPLDARLLLEARFELRALRPERRNLRATLAELAPRVEIRVDRPDVEEPDHAEDDERQEPARRAEAPSPASPSVRGAVSLRHAAVFDAERPLPVAPMRRRP